MKGIFSQGDAAAPQKVPHPCGLFQRRGIPWNSPDSTPGGARQGCVHGVPVALRGDTLGVSQSPGVPPEPLPFLSSDRIHKPGHHGQIHSLSCQRPLPKAGKSWESRRPECQSHVALTESVPSRAAWDQGLILLSISSREKCTGIIPVGSNVFGDRRSLGNLRIWGFLGTCMIQLLIKGD